MKLDMLVVKGLVKGEVDCFIVLACTNKLTNPKGVFYNLLMSHVINPEHTMSVL